MTSRDETDDEVTILAPWDEAARAMSHVKGPRRIRKPDRRQNTDQSRNSSLQSKLYLCFMGVPRCKRHCDDVPRKKISSPARNLHV